jgi:hypothetical protein
MPFHLLVVACSRQQHSHGTGEPSSENPFIILAFSINSLVYEVFQNNWTDIMQKESKMQIIVLVLNGVSFIKYQASIGKVR